MRYIIITLFTVVLLVSCSSQGNRPKIIGTWQAVSLENPVLDERMRQHKNFIDTIGSNTTEEQNLEIYEFTNIDSAKQALGAEIERYWSEQKEVINATTFEFRKDNTAILHFREGSENAEWSINNEGKLVVDHMKNQNTDAIEMDIIELNDSVLTLKMLHKGIYTTVVFEPVDK